MMEWLRARGTQIGIVAVLVAAAAALAAYYAFYVEEPAPAFTTDEEHFLYGSTGVEGPDTVPYWIWLVLPRIFPEYLPGPGGYASLGLLWADGREMPVGLSRVTVGVPRVGATCALCHTTSVRTEPGGPRSLVPGGPSNVTSPQQYLRFLIACASDPRFTADVILAEIARNYELSAYERLLYRFVLVPRTRRALLALGERAAWMDRNPDAGPGRADFVNLAKFHRLGQPADATIGTADMMPLWGLAPDATRAYGWDGGSTDLAETVRAWALVAGADAGWLDRDAAGADGADPDRVSSLGRVLDYVRDARPPAFPLPVETTLSARGAAVFRTMCAECHAPGGARTGTVVPIEEIGTDRHRLVAWTPAAAEAFNGLSGRGWAFSGFRSTEGYVAVPLEGLWLRGPYLHNGSVPTLADLLEPPGGRPAVFWRGSDVLDAAKVGFVSTGPEAQAGGTRFDTSLPGNGNGGHAYGTTLDPESKRALLEFLKTL